MYLLPYLSGQDSRLATSTYLQKELQGGRVVYEVPYLKVGMYEMLPCGRILEVGRYMYAMLCYATLLETRNLPTRLFESLIGGGGGG